MVCSPQQPPNGFSGGNAVAKLASFAALSAAIESLQGADVACI